jgi:hypothetical protein
MSQFSFSEKRLTAIVEKAVNNAFASQKDAPKPPYPEWDYLPSIVALSDFLECSYSSAKRFKKAGLIKFEQQGTKVKFYIPDILEAIEKHERVGKYIDRLCEKYPPAGSPQIPKKEPKIRIETELFPGRFMFIKIKYQGWGCTICTSPDLWENQSLIRELVNEVIKEQNQRKPFKVSSL